MNLFRNTALIWGTAAALWASDYDSGMKALREGRPADALVYLDAARRFSPSDLEILYGLATCYFALGRTEEAEKTAEEVANAHRSDPAVLLAVGSLFLQHGFARRAAELLAASDALSPGNPMVLAALSRALLESGETVMAEHALERLAAALGRSATLETQSALRKARESARRLQFVHPDSLRPALLVAEFSLLLGEYAEGIKALEPYRASNNADLFGLLANLYAHLDRTADAMRAGRKAVELAPERSDLVLALAGVYQKARDNLSAIRLLEGALARDKASPELYFALALSQFNFGDFATAISNCDRALALDGNFERAALLKGRAYARSSKPVEAARWLRKALAMNPACDFCRYELAIVLAANHGEAEAETLLREVLRTNPHHGAAHYQLGKLLAARKDATAAITEFEAAIASDPTQDGAYYQLGRLYTSAGEKEKASAAMAAVKRLKAKRRDAAEARLSGSQPD